MKSNTNFFFLISPWASIGESARKAEQYVITDPTASAIYARQALEKLLFWQFDHDSSLTPPLKEKIGLNDLLFENSFQKTYYPTFGKDLNYIRRTGNNAAHGSFEILPNESTACVKYLFRYALFIVRTFSENPPDNLAELRFDEALIPTQGAGLLTGELEKLRKENDSVKGELERTTATLAQKEEQLLLLQQQLDAYQSIKLQNGPVSAPEVLTEAQTRQLYIDELLKEAGWNPQDPLMLEVWLDTIDEATEKPAKLRADYVLWGKDGKPLAVVEAKRTQIEAEWGRRQAYYYANALEKMYGQRPVIFYTNGFETFIWDDVYYTPRRIYGFYSLEELQTLIIRRHQRESLTKQKVNTDIAGRVYQQRAIRRVCERLEDEKQRRALLVMATGTGKTRVSAAIVELLAKAQWIKRVLFLADRNALVNQAKKAFKIHLPHIPAIDLTKETDDGSARVVFSTYPTMMNRIDGDFRDKKRYYGVGHFDLIIIDEAHRSVYDRYGALFDYFDGYYLGLTATPKSETDRDTYELFHCLPNEPTDAYEYTPAVEEGHLVKALKIELPLKFPQSGIRYADLTDDEKEDYERKFYNPETGQIPPEINPGAINQWLFNENTVDIVLQTLMSIGHKVEGNEKIGKTIIFARNHEHADFIKKRFRASYPQYHDTFAEIIDNYAQDAERLIDLFKEPAEFPQIAISVDMLDTGIDIPEVVNLVFFKPVFSSSKFWQMLGRGTRLCKDLYGTDNDKQDFYVFDVCQVFAFFGHTPEGIKPSRAISLSERLFNARTELSLILENRDDYQPDTETWVLRGQTVSILHQQVAALDKNRFEVHRALRHVEEYRQEKAWYSLTKDKVKTLQEYVSPLIQDLESDEMAKRFDVLVLNLQLAVLRSERSQQNYIQKVMETGRLLLKNSHLPSIAPQKPLLQAMTQTEFWSGVSMPQLEKIRVELRGLTNLIEKKSRGTVYTNFEDQLTDVIKVEEFAGSYSNLSNHYAKLRKIILEHRDHLTIRKLHLNQQITQEELNELDKMLFAESGIDTYEIYQKAIGDRPLGIFIRSIVGLDNKAANKAFEQFLTNGPLSSLQMAFLNDLITLFTKQGIIDPNLLFLQPFNKYHDEGVAGVFSNDAEKVLSMVKETNRRALA